MSKQQEEMRYIQFAITAEKRFRCLVCEDAWKTYSNLGSLGRHYENKHLKGPLE